MMAQDPFYIVKGRVQETMAKVSSDVKRWQQLRSSRDTAGEHFTQLTNQIRGNLKAASNDLLDLSKTITVVENGRSKFPSITDEELDSRRTFVRDTTAQKNKYEKMLQNSYAEGQRQRDSRRALGLDRSSAASPSGFNSGGYLQNQLQQQRDIEAQQDALMDDMVVVLDRMKDQSEGIGTRLHTHQELLSDMDTEFDEAGDSMTLSLMKMERLLKRNNAWRWSCIWFLIIVFIVQFILISTAI